VVPVREHYRGQGIGKQLFEAAELSAKSGGARWLRLSVLASNHAARRLYESLGFSALYVDFEIDLGAND
jgi:ribosomal protein S18 acetylase RimI-like enzyme